MKGSVLFQRIILLLLAAVILSGLISAGIYIFITQKMYVQTRADELMPIARAVSVMLSDTGLGGDGLRGVWPLLGRGNKDFLGALLHIYDAGGASVMNPPPDSGRMPEPPEDFGLAEVASAALETVLSGRELSVIRESAEGKAYLVVGAPVQSGGEVVGAVVFTKAVSELRDAMNGLNLTLLISTFIAFVIMMVPGYVMARFLVVPIRQMRDVARAMARGDFSSRADESQKGEIGELARSMNILAVESERLEQIRRDYVANVSHELRTPIAAIRAMGETLRDGLAKSVEKRDLFYNNIVRESMRLSRLVDDLLELSRLQAGNAPMQKTCFDLREVFQNAADVYSHIAAGAGLLFALDVDLEREILVCSNADRVEQLVVILLDNAIKHTPEGGRVALALQDGGEKLYVCVTDTGAGVAKEDIPHIFERFYKADKSRSGEGTGLGLSIAREIIKTLGETIWVECGETGAKFMFSLTKQ